MNNSDSLQRFLFEQAPIRGELVHLNSAWTEILKRHDYPDSVRQVLGEMAAATVLITSMLKFEGSIIMQIQGQGPLRMAVVEATSERTLRGMAQWQGDVTAADFPQLVGENSTLFITIDPKAGERYQGVVDISLGSIARAIEDYMQRSQQLQTRLYLYADAGQAGGMMLQRMPSRAGELQQDEDADSWNRINCLADTAKPEELRDLPFEQLLHRLFHEELVRIFDIEPVSFRCSCNRERVGNMLKLLGLDELRDILQSEGKLGINCQFCNHYYEYDAVDAEELFAAEIKTQVPPTRH